jgi:hypothetical protein
MSYATGMMALVSAAHSPIAALDTAGEAKSLKSQSKQMYDSISRNTRTKKTRQTEEKE